MGGRGIWGLRDLFLRRRNGHLWRGGRGKILTERESSGVLFRLPLSRLRVLLDVALEVDLGTLWKKAFTAFLAATTEAVTTSFGAHACAETVLAFAGALGWLIGAFHGERGWWLRFSPWAGGQTRDFRPLVNPAFARN